MLDPNKVLNLNDKIKHGKDIDVVCHNGFFLNGPARLRCWFGEWSGGASSVFGMPKCVGNPCALPEITGTIYNRVATKITHNLLIYHKFFQIDHLTSYENINLYFFH